MKQWTNTKTQWNTLQVSLFYSFCPTKVTVDNNSPIQDYVHPDDQTQPTFEKFRRIFQSAFGCLGITSMAFQAHSVQGRQSGIA